MKTRSSERISSAIASRNASRTVIVVVGPSQSSSSWIGEADGCADAVGAVGAAGASATDKVAGAAGASLASSPSPARRAITAPTATLSVPSAIMISLTTPSSTASTSIVALSVSISASKSPERTSSPSETSHFDKRPSVIVGDKAGILISIAMIFSLTFAKNAGFKRDQQGCLYKAHPHVVAVRSRQSQWRLSPPVLPAYQAPLAPLLRYLHAQAFL